MKDIVVHIKGRNIEECIIIDKDEKDVKGLIIDYMAEKYPAYKLGTIYHNCIFFDKSRVSSISAMIFEANHVWRNYNEGQGTKKFTRRTSAR